MTRLSDVMANARGARIGASAPVAGGHIVIPERVQIRGGLVEWSGERAEDEWQLAYMDDACLRRFMRLRDAPAEHIARFAERYGPLFLGENGAPVARESLPIREESRDGGPVPRRHKPDWEADQVRILTRDEAREAHRVRCSIRTWYQEPIEGWRAWAKYFAVVYVLSHELRTGERIVPDVRLSRLGFDLGPKDWEIPVNSPCVETTPQGELTLSPLGETVYERLWPWYVVEWLDKSSTAEGQWAALIGLLNLNLFERTSMRYALMLAGPASAPRIALARPFAERFHIGNVRSAFPTIAGQLLAAITNGERSHMCVDCHLPYAVQRRRKNGRCPECGKRARSAAVQKSKAKRRAKDQADQP